MFKPGQYLPLVFLFAFIPVQAAQEDSASVTVSGSASSSSPPVVSDQMKAEVAKNLANPVANMVSVPFEINWNRGLGAGKAGSNVNVLFQPVAPFELGGGDLLIVRPIFSTTWSQNVNGFTGSGESGPQLETFYAPYTGSKNLIVGIGPYISAPSGSSGMFGSQQTGLGLSAVVAYQNDMLTTGVLLFNSWGVGSNTSSGTQNNAYAQPFIGLHNSRGESLGMSMQSTYNYDATKSSNQIILNAGKVLSIDKQTVQVSGGPIYNINSFPGGPQGWGARLNITFAFLK